ncbi:hypothetical protein H5410_031315 [Solanum commersonii]|uniref:Uncharacterized protein n=1 Tax=Solanum commersonii TaxID=4109 RepID=A0A9J5YI27_SOLCO|nr:hypothetical protein H5410_031315 [Solanum commersonii]
MSPKAFDDSLKVFFFPLYLHPLNFVHCNFWRACPCSSKANGDTSSELEAKHGYYLARRNKEAEKNEEMKARGSPSPVGESLIDLEIAFCFSVLSPEGKD